MMPAVPQPLLTGRDPRARLTWALLASVLVHAFIVLGIRPDAGLPRAASILRATLIPVSAPEPVAIDPTVLPASPRELKSSALPARVEPPETHAAGEPAAPAREQPAEQAPPVLPAYYAARDVDLRAVPRDVSHRSRQERSMLLGRMATVKLRLYISDRGTVDRFDVLEAEGLSSQSSLEEVYEIGFHPAMKNGRPVASVKLVELSFVP
jgi:hypothetical protein